MKLIVLSDVAMKQKEKYNLVKDSNAVAGAKPVVYFCLMTFSPTGDLK